MAQRQGHSRDEHSPRTALPLEPEPALELEELRVAPGPTPAAVRLPSLAVVILNCNGRQHLERCLESLSKQDYPADRRTVWMIDNASDDGSVEELRARWPWVKLEVNQRNRGFSAGCNQGAALARSAEVLVFLNNDMRVEPDFLTELVAPIVRGEAACTGGKLLAWDGKSIDTAGGGMNFHGIGMQFGYRELPSGIHDVPRRTLFACGGAMAVRADVFRAAGGFDEEYFAYYEDVDLGWRLWVLGHEVHYAPRAVGYHHHSSTSKRFPPETLRLLQVRNPLYSCFKNYDDEHLRQFLPALLALAQARAHLLGGLASQERDFRIEHARPGQPPASPAGAGDGAPWRARLAGRLLGDERMAKLRLDLASQVGLHRLGAADWLGLQDLLGHLDHWLERRAKVQSARQRADARILPLFLKPLWCVEADASYQNLQRTLVRWLGIDAVFRGLSIRGHDPR